MDHNCPFHNYINFVKIKANNTDSSISISLWSFKKTVWEQKEWSRLQRKWGECSFLLQIFSVNHNYTEARIFVRPYLWDHPGHPSLPLSIFPSSTMFFFFSQFHLMPQQMLCSTQHKVPNPAMLRGQPRGALGFSMQEARTENHQFPIKLRCP